MSITIVNSELTTLLFCGTSLKIMIKVQVLDIANERLFSWKDAC